MAITCLLLDRKHRILGVLLEVVNGDGRDVFCEHKPHTSLSLSLSLSRFALYLSAQDKLTLLL